MTVVEPMCSPCVSALQIFCRQVSAVWCCGLSPGWGRFALMLMILTGVCVRVASAMVVLRICPPPSPYEPSICIMFCFHHFVRV